MTKIATAFYIKRYRVNFYVTLHLTNRLEQKYKSFWKIIFEMAPVL